MGCCESKSEIITICKECNHHVHPDINHPKESWNRKKIIQDCCKTILNEKEKQICFKCKKIHPIKDGKHILNIIELNRIYGELIPYEEEEIYYIDKLSFMDQEIDVKDYKIIEEEVEKTYCRESPKTIHKPYQYHEIRTEYKTSFENIWDNQVRGWKTISVTKPVNINFTEIRYENKTIMEKKYYKKKEIEIEKTKIEIGSHKETRKIPFNIKEKKTRIIKKFNNILINLKLLNINVLNVIVLNVLIIHYVYVEFHI